ncbi:hypothetical protein BT96DRAFT_1008236 [Gymnopus androsaceus JB14]|uniref:Uncharacterized protein n=1 Tax=Gymnopus androsaceus JB14 TaxID=1447944 RepID=A0A6A4GFM5_9AGAR|nr:hypothetical protein BT96DRAFT_1008236 [Gymnopus androsaceus JB14]
MDDTANPHTPSPEDQFPGQGETKEFFSETFKACFTLPQPAGIKEGLIFEKPILLPVDAAPLNALCSFIFHLQWKPHNCRTTDELLALGEISQLLQCPDALKFTIQALKFRTFDFNKARKVFYAFKFGVPNWGYSATAKILTSDNGVGSITGGFTIDMEIHKLLLEGESNLALQIQLLAREMPNLNDNATWSQCPQRDWCMKTLIRGWETIGPAIAQTRGGICQIKILVKEKVENDHSFALMRQEAAGERVKAHIK